MTRLEIARDAANSGVARVWPRGYPLRHYLDRVETDDVRRVLGIVGPLVLIVAMLVLLPAARAMPPGQRVRGRRAMLVGALLVASLACVVTRAALG
jgi:hypothetical protein